MRTYSAGGACHRILARLDEGHAKFSDLAAAVGPPANKAHTRTHYCLEALREDGLLDKFALTPLGRQALADLRDGIDYGAQPSVRVFGRRAA